MLKRKSVYVALLAMLSLMTHLNRAIADDPSPNYNIGIYYFPGWRDDQRGAPSAKPWDRIKMFPERQPLLGWYKDGDVAIAERHIDWMAEYGIDYVVYDWFWDGSPFLEHSISAFMRARNNNKLKFSLLWANHSKVPEKLEQFTSMVQYWIKYYFPKNNYLKIDGKPAVFVFAPSRLQDNAKKFGHSANDLIKVANKLARDAGYDGIYFIAGAKADRIWINERGPQSGFDAFSAYNYHRGFSGSVTPLTRMAHSFSELDSAYQQNWDWILQNSPLPYILPIISGWDKRAWGGSTDPLHDNSFGTPIEFENHLIAAKSRLDQYPAKTRKTTVICCWNEFGEGSYIEPTKRDGLEYLKRVRKVFGTQP